MPATIRTGAAYIRVSTHGKQEELSPDAQKRLIRDYAKKIIFICHLIIFMSKAAYPESLPRNVRSSSG